ncbi:MAG: LPXTG cell wall anchor domain-containing protein [Planctomycetota bacterium]
MTIGRTLPDPAGNYNGDDDLLAEGEDTNQSHVAPEPTGIAIWAGIALMGGTAVWYRRRRRGG